MSLRLKNYEKVDKNDFKINLNSRTYISQENQQNPSNPKTPIPGDKSKQIIDTKTNFNPLSSYDDYNKNKFETLLNNNTTNRNVRQSQNAQFFNSVPGNFNPRPPQSFMYLN